jgi:hypothetical protein
MLAKSEKHDFLYRQLYVFCGDLDQPYNNWSPQEYLQGFAYRVHSVISDDIRIRRMQGKYIHR